MKKLILIFMVVMMAGNAGAQEKINVTVGSRTFAATLEDNAAAKGFAKLLPANWTMNELNGNEKYCYLNSALPTAAYSPGTIQEGDIMLFGSSCVVLFYKTFQSGYSYTKIGHLDDAAGLAAALGGSSVAVKFSAQNATGIAGTTGGDGKTEGEGWFSLSGTKVERPAKGIFVHKGRKIILK